jgi:nicotinate-nucleotide adenylyltransferase
LAGTRPPGRKRPSQHIPGAVYTHLMLSDLDYRSSHWQEPFWLPLPQGGEGTLEAMLHPTNPGTSHIRLARPAPQGLGASGRNRLGVLGGAYNPITLAHLAMADTAVEAFHLHEVLFLLPQVPPHKTIFGASLEQRLAMMQLAVADRSYAAVGLSTHGLFIDIYQALQELYPHQPAVYFLTGRDAAERILTWDYVDTATAYRQMFTSFQLIVCDRDGGFHLPHDARLCPYRNRIHRCQLPANYDHVSSTAIRQRCQQGRPITDLVPAAVASYITEHGLYKD